MICLPDEILDEVVTLAVALGTISANVTSRICFRWKSKYQKVLFRTITLDPFETDTILDLITCEHKHLTSYIEELRVFPRSASLGLRWNHGHDLSSSFTNFLCNLENLSAMILSDEHIQWGNVSSINVDLLVDVFRRESFRSLAVSVSKPGLPSWMLLSASKLTIQCVNLIMPPLPSTGLTLELCSLTHLVLLGNTAIHRLAEFCVEPFPDSAKGLLGKLNHLELEYIEPYITLGPTLTPWIENLILFLGTQLKVLDIHIISSYNFGHTPSISMSALQRLISLQRISLKHSGHSKGNKILMPAQQYLHSFLDGLPLSSRVASLSLTIDERMPVNSRVDSNYLSGYESLLTRISAQLASNKWRRLTSGFITVNLQGNFTGPAYLDDCICIASDAERLFRSRLRVNKCKVEHHRIEETNLLDSGTLMSME